MKYQPFFKQTVFIVGVFWGGDNRLKPLNPYFIGTHKNDPLKRYIKRYKKIFGTPSLVKNQSAK